MFILVTLSLMGNYGADLQEYYRLTPIVEVGDSCPHCEVVVAHLKRRGKVFMTRKVATGPIPRFCYLGEVVEGANLQQIDALLDRPVVRSSSIVRSTRVYSVPTVTVVPSYSTQIATYSAATPIYSSRPRISYSGAQWTWPGNLKSHLMAEHSYSAQQLAGLSHSELVALHNTDHNSGSSGTRFRSSNNFRSSGNFRPFHRRGLFRSSSCPGGVCP